MLIEIIRQEYKIYRRMRENIFLSIVILNMELVCVDTNNYENLRFSVYVRLPFLFTLLPYYIFGLISHFQVKMAN
jgi:hypothetical protein